MKLYVFGNESVSDDAIAVEIAQKLLLDKNVNANVVYVKPNQDLPFAGEDKVIIMDVVKGIDNIKLFTQDDLDKLKLSKSSTAHDYDLGFQLKYLKKINKLNKLRIIAIPYDYKKLGFTTNTLCAKVENLLLDPLNL